MNCESKKNIRLLYIQTVFKNITSFIITGGVLQTFFLEFGVADTDVSLAVALFQLSQAVTMILFSGRLERVKGLIRVDQKLLILMLPLLLAMAFVSICEIGAKTAFFILIPAGLVTYAGIGLTGSLAYKIPYVLIDMKDYGRISGIQGTLSGIVCMALAAVLSLVLKRFSYDLVAPFLLLAGIIAVAMNVFTFGAMREKEEMPRFGGDRIDLFRYRPFLRTIIPNAARGFGGGLLGIMTTIGYHAGMLDGVNASLMVFVTYATSMAGSFLFARFTNRERDGKIVLLCGIVLAAAMPVLFMGGSFFWFLTIFTVCQFFRAIMDVATPAALVKVIDYDAVLQCAAWRLALYMGGASAAVLVAVPLVDAIGYTPTFLLGGLMNLIAGIGYYRLTK